MGLTINGNIVAVDHNSKDHLYTEIYGNPSQYTAGNIKTLSVYRRKKSSGHNKRNRNANRTGDNCPLIYALKQINGLSVKINSIKYLMKYMPTILDNIVNILPKDFTEIVTIPSAYPLASILAKRLALRMNIPVLNDLLQKSTCFNATIRANSILLHQKLSIDRKTEVSIRNSIKKIRKTPNAPYSSKSTNTLIRKYFDPLSINKTNYLFTAKSKVLLVDDLLSSGETIVAADQLLKKIGLTSNCMAVTWFGRV